MTYDIHITRTAERDLISAADYIERVLFNPDAADRLLDEAEKKINALSTYPKRFALADDPILKAWGIRFTHVNNYIVFYTVSDETHTVCIVRFLYEKREWTTILKQGISLE